MKVDSDGKPSNEQLNDNAAANAKPKRRGRPPGSKMPKKSIPVTSDRSAADVAGDFRRKLDDVDRKLKADYQAGKKTGQGEPLPIPARLDIPNGEYTDDEIKKLRQSGSPLLDSDLKKIGFESAKPDPDPFGWGEKPERFGPSVPLAFRPSISFTGYENTGELPNVPDRNYPTGRIGPIADILHASEYFGDKTPAQIAVYILAGQELGFGPIKSLFDLEITAGSIAFTGSMPFTKTSDDVEITNSANKGVLSRFNDKRDAEAAKGSETTGAAAKLTSAGPVGEVVSVDFGQGLKCPDCDSPKPALHPAVQFEGEVSICKNPFHGEPAAADVFTAETIEPDPAPILEPVEVNTPEPVNEFAAIAADAPDPVTPATLPADNVKSDVTPAAAPLTADNEARTLAEIVSTNQLEEIRKLGGAADILYINAFCNQEMKCNVDALSKTAAADFIQILNERIALKADAKAPDPEPVQDPPATTPTPTLPADAGAFGDETQVMRAKVQKMCNELGIDCDDKLSKFDACPTPDEKAKYHQTVATYYEGRIVAVCNEVWGILADRKLSEPWDYSPLFDTIGVNVDNAKWSYTDAAKVLQYLQENGPAAA